MSMVKLAFQNFKSSFKNYLSLIISLAFTILIFLNFQNVIYSDTLQLLGESNARNIKIVIQCITVVLSCFMLFFIWYSTNVFLSKRKKEIGIYVFMGLTHQKIACLYMFETTMIGIVALLLGLGFGLITTQLFQMILLAISDISIEIQFCFSIEPILITTVVYLFIYMLFVIKGYINIVSSSVLDMISAIRQNEYVKQKFWILMIKAIIGICALGYGYYLANKNGGIEVLGNVLLAVVFVIIGIYFIFGGFIPLLFQSLAKNKMFLYKKERNLWINNVIFRIKKNYRTYAIVCVLMLCSVTALATGFAMKNRYEGIIHFRNTYTYQLISYHSDLDNQIDSLIEKDNDIEYKNSLPVLEIDSSYFKTSYQTSYMIISYSDCQKAAEEAHLSFDIDRIADDEIVNVTQLHMMSFITDKSHISVSINNKTYQQINETSTPYLGIFQEKLNFYLVSDQTYEKLKEIGKEFYFYNYRIKDNFNYKASINALDSLVNETENNYTSYIAIDPMNSDIEWIKILYSVCIFMFMVFVLASGSILFMKLFNDAFEDKGRYEILSKLGVDQRTLKKSIANELRFAYITPFLLMSFSSYFSVLSLAKLMETELLMVNIVSVFIIMVFFMICYCLSVSIYQKNVGI